MNQIRENDCSQNRYDDIRQCIMDGIMIDDCLQYPYVHYPSGLCTNLNNHRAYQNNRNAFNDPGSQLLLTPLNVDVRTGQGLHQNLIDYQRSHQQRGRQQQQQAQRRRRQVTRVQRVPRRQERGRSRRRQPQIQRRQQRIDQNDEPIHVTPHDIIQTINEQAQQLLSRTRFPRDSDSLLSFIRQTHILIRRARLYNLNPLVQQLEFFNDNLIDRIAR